MRRAVPDRRLWGRVNPATAGRFDIRSIPTLLVIAGGREVDRILGAQPKQAIRARLERFIAGK